LGLPPGQLRQGRLTYLLRRLRLHGLIERLPRSHRYRVTPLGLRTSVLAVRAHARLLRPGLAELGPSPHAIGDAPLRRAFERLERTIDARFAQAGLVA
jgi:DNA-binding PadR family transcriptional regulator